MSRSAVAVDLGFWSVTDSVLAELAAHAAVTAGDDDSARFEVDMTELYTLRARIFAALAEKETNA